MTYVKQAPTEPGYYWLKTGDTEEIVEAWTDPAANERHLWIHHCGDGEGCEIGTFPAGLWAGPIPKPVGG